MNRAEQLLTALGPSDAPGWVHHQASVRAMRGVAEFWAGWHEDAGQILRSGLASVPPDQARGAEYLALASELRRAGLGVELYPDAKKLGEQLKYADRRGFRLAVIAGPAELEAGEVQLKVLATGEAKKVARGALAAECRAALTR